MAEQQRVIRQFFDTVFPDLGGQWLLLWRLPSKQSVWVQEISDDVIEQIVKWNEIEDVYVGCGLSPRSRGPHERCPADQVSGITALWLDIDYAAGHKKQGLPPTQEDARELLEAMGAPATMIVHSGHGLHGWWVFKEPWLFPDDAERSKGAALCLGWSRTLMAKAKAQGYTADNVGDLARVMRIPGTWNRKGVDVKSRILHTSEYLWDPTGFDDYLDLKAEAPAPAAHQVFDILLDPTAEAPTDKFLFLLEEYPKFKQAWLHQRGLGSVSEYDLSLATIAYMNGWAPQEIVNLLIAHRRKYQEDLKIRYGERPTAPQDYYQMTLNKAGQVTVTEERQHLIDQFRKGMDLPEEVKKDKAELKQILSQMLGVQIGRMVKLLTKPPHYSLEVNGKLIDMGTVEYLDSEMKFRRFLMDYTGHRLQSQKGAWHRISQMLLDLCEEETTGVAEARMDGWIANYLNDTGVQTEDWQHALLTHRPFQKDGHTFISSKGLGKYLAASLNEKWNQRDLVIRLRGIGATDQKLRMNNQHGKTTRMVWQLPAELSGNESTLY